MEKVNIPEGKLGLWEVKKFSVSKEDAKFLLNQYNPIRQYGMVNKYIDLHVKALSILRGTPASVPSCGCEYGAYARIASSMYEQHEQAIKDAAYPPVETSPSEIIEEAVTSIQTLPNEIAVKTTRGRKKSNI